MNDWCVNMRAYNFFVNIPKFTIFSFNAGEAVVNYLLFRFLISPPVS